MIRTLVFIAILIGLAFAGAWLVEQPGQVVVTLPRYGQIQTTLIGAAAALTAFVVAVLLLWTVLRFLLRLPSILSFTARARKRARGFSAVSRGMIAVGSGDPRSARRYAAEAAKLLGKEPLALLLKAQAAQMAGDRGQAEGAFRQMLDDNETRVLGLRGLFVEARRKGDSTAARAYAAEAARLAPSVAWAGEALLEFQCADQDWTGALATLDRGARSLDKAAVKRQRAVLLAADALARAEREPEAALMRAQQAVKLAPGLVPAATLASRLHARKGELRRASKTIEAAWAQGSHPDLAAAYMEVRPGDSARDRLARAERLLALRPHDSEGRIAVASAALQARDLKRARKALMPLLETRPSTRVCLLMADIEEADGAAGAVREWLARASRAPRDPAWIADGVIADRWSPVSPVTGRLDAFVWGAPMEQIEAPAEEPFRPAPPEPLPLPTSEHVMADVDEAPAPVLADKAEPEPPAVEPAREPAAEAPPEPAAPAEPVPPPPAVPPKAAEPAADTGRPREQPALRVVGEGEPAPSTGTVPVVGPEQPASAVAAPDARARRTSPPSEVIFPLAAAPDDPGPDRSDQPRRGAITFLQ